MTSYNYKGKPITGRLAERINELESLIQPRGWSSISDYGEYIGHKNGIHTIKKLLKWHKGRLKMIKKEKVA